ncbi:ATP synthase mitochondrial F1 complex assembly factor 1 [Fusarium oxysporum]|nr:ATP synthase mitochondrial F1 complex assembly factor 1 [Fusarium oxysporum]
MASLRIPALRRLVAAPIRTTRAINQRRWAQVHDIRFLATTQPSQAVVEKYKEKLNQKAQKEGLQSIDQLKAAYADKIDAERRKSGIEIPVGTIPQAPETPVVQPNADNPPGQDQPTRDPRDPPTTPPQHPPAGSDKPAIKTLNDIIDLPRHGSFQRRSLQLSGVYDMPHLSRTSVLTSIRPPVPHPSQGAEIHFLQWTFDAASKTSTVLFTQLAEYKNRGEFAQPHTTITHHLDLADERGLVLMQGQVLPDRGVTPENAKWLLMSLQRFYGGWDGEEVELTGERKDRAGERKKLLNWFAAGDSRFSVDKLLEEAERMG